jgi:hypothetical protein
MTSSSVLTITVSIITGLFVLEVITIYLSGAQSMSTEIVDIQRAYLLCAVLVLLAGWSIATLCRLLHSSTKAITQWGLRDE